MIVRIKIVNCIRNSNFSVAPYAGYHTLAFVYGLPPGRVSTVYIRFGVYPFTSGIYAEMEMRIGHIRRVSASSGIAYQVALEDLVVKLERLARPRVDRKGHPSPEMRVLIDDGLVLLPGLNTEFVAIGVAYMLIPVSAFRLRDHS